MQVLIVFSNIGLGNIAASIVFLILLKAFQGAIASDQNNLEWVWRLLLGVGIVPAALTLYARLTISETEPYKHCQPPSQNSNRRILTRIQMFAIILLATVVAGRSSGRIFASTSGNGDMPRCFLQLLLPGFSCMYRTNFQNRDL